MPTDLISDLGLIVTLSLKLINIFSIKKYNSGVFCHLQRRFLFCWQKTLYSVAIDF